MDNYTKQEILNDCIQWLKDYVESTVSDLFARLEEKIDREYAGSIGKLVEIQEELKNLEGRLRKSEQDRRKYLTSSFYEDNTEPDKMFAERILDNDFDR